LPGECGIASAAKLKSALLKRVGDAGSVTLDASAVQRVDSAGLQVLAAFARDRRAAGLALEWASVPRSLADAASLLSLTDVLGFAARPG
jgi:ABC-type transporter Mla MlaB component